jgi:hypothetical protein
MKLLKIIHLKFELNIKKIQDIIRNLANDIINKSELEPEVKDSSIERSQNDANNKQDLGPLFS